MVLKRKAQPRVEEPVERKIEVGAGEKPFIKLEEWLDKNIELRTNHKGYNSITLHGFDEHGVFVENEGGDLLFCPWFNVVEIIWREK